MSDTPTGCRHEEHDKANSIYADGLCPICLRRDLAAREAELAEARDALQFVERWANYHGVKPTCTAKAALSAIQHYPPIREITESYKDGKIPETRNPWEELSAATDRAEKAEAERDAVRKAASILCAGFDGEAVYWIHDKPGMFFDALSAIDAAISAKGER